jgi:hypothetical protein
MTTNRFIPASLQVFLLSLLLLSAVSAHAQTVESLQAQPEKVNFPPSCLTEVQPLFEKGGSGHKPSLPCGRAQTTPQSPPPKSASPVALSNDQQKIDPTKEADIRKLLELTGTTTIMKQTMESMETSIKPMVTNSLPEGDYREKLVDLFFERFHAKMDTPKLLELAVPIYDKYFSGADIKGLIQFYQTPLGQKTVKVLPQLTGEMREAGQKMGADVARQSIMEVLTEHPELEKAIGEAQKPTQP